MSDDYILQNVRFNNQGKRFEANPHLEKKPWV